ncbi:MAG: AAA family ATPase, partial [Actinobacteria bacterium]|nr:AAA family ATPase [Actinomycetota bacterium]
MLGLHHHIHDADRAIVPVSSTQIRKDLIGNWHLLGPGSRELLAIRAVFIGAESTGTTTTALAVQDALKARGGNFKHTNYIREYGRDLTMRKREQAETLGMPEYAVPWTVNDFVEIAIVQQQLEDVAARTGGPIVSCDTDVLATLVWERRYLGAKASLPMPANSPNRIYFVTQPDGVSFVQDKIRDSAEMREEMTRDSRVFCLGEDIGLYGGAYGATRGLFEKFGKWRVLDTPISEASIAGAAVGAAMSGMRPV